MQKSLSQKISCFLKNNWDQKSPLLLGYSGGADSKALLYLLLEAGIPSSLLHLAHLDHSWRKTSFEEAKNLEKEARQLGVFFHLHHLEPLASDDLRNLEDRGRKERLLFFKTLFDQYPFQALFLAHQQEDLAETVFKRVLEGAPIFRLGGMKKVSQSEHHFLIWRPLLDVSKSEILFFLEEKKISFFKDPSNEDPSYLRVRMRQEIFPCLERNFQKNFLNNLCLLSERSFELEKYLEEKIEEKEVADFFSVEGLKVFEAKFLLQKEMKKKGISLGRKLLQEIIDALFKKKRDLFFPFHLRAHQGKLFFKTKK